MNLQNLIGLGKDLTILQMTLRAVLAFIIAYTLIRISGRRSFGLHGPMDNIIVILLGAILSRGVVGASPFLHVIVASIAIVFLHRGVGRLMSIYPKFGDFAEGQKITLFEHGKFIHTNMKRALIGEEEIMHAIRNNLLTESTDQVKKIYMERNGEISIVKKHTDS